VNTLGAIAALVSMWACGAALLVWVVPDPGRFSRAGRMGLAFGLGLLVVPHSLFLASYLGWVPSGWTVGALFLVLAGLAAGWRRERLGDWLRPGAAPPITGPGWLRRLDAVLLASIAAPIGLVSLYALSEPLVEWDVLAIWATKAVVLLSEPIASSGYFQDISKAYSHLDYPLLWPFTLSWIWVGAGGPDLWAVKVLVPALLLAYAATFHSLLSQRADRSTALLFTALLLGIPMLLSQIARLQADPLLGYFALAAGACTWLWVVDERDDCLRLAGLFASAVLLTKNEGIAFYGVLVAATAVALLRERPRSRGRGRLLQGVLWLVALPIAITRIWFALRAGIPRVHEDYGERLRLSNLLENADRIPEIVTGAIPYALDVRDWLLFWPALALLLVAGARFWLRGSALFLFVLAWAPVLLYGAIFVVSPWKPGDLLEFSASRLLLHTLPLQVLLAAEVVRRAGWLPWPTPDQSRA
jgi:hypothetical protein